MKKNPYILIRGRKIGAGFPVYVIAELSANHNRDYSEAVRLVKAAKIAGADAIKIQTYTPDTLTLQCDSPDFRVKGGTLWDGRKLYDLYKEAAMPWDWQPKLKKLAEKLRIELFSTAFDATAVDFLEKMKVRVHKIASFELVDIPLIKKMAATGKPLILSTGMASLRDIQDAVSAARGAGAKNIALLKCTSAYPALADEMNLRTIPHMEKHFHVPVGLSDHTLGSVSAIASVVMGASIVEKHLTLSRKKKGPDSAFSLEPQEFREMVDAIRSTEKALGRVHYGSAVQEAKSKVFRRSLYAVADIQKGEIFTKGNVRSIRPAFGLAPKFFEKIMGCRARKAISRGTALARSHIGRIVSRNVRRREL